MFRSLTDPGEQTLTIHIDGQAFAAAPGESVAAVIMRMDRPVCRTTPRQEQPRAPFCLMGVCFECLAVVDGNPSTQTCLTPVRDGMRIERQNSKRGVL